MSNRSVGRVYVRSTRVLAHRRSRNVQRAANASSTEPRSAGKIHRKKRRIVFDACTTAPYPPSSEKLGSVTLSRASSRGMGRHSKETSAKTSCIGRSSACSCRYSAVASLQRRWNVSRSSSLSLIGGRTGSNCAGAASSTSPWRMLLSATLPRRCLFGSPVVSLLESLMLMGTMLTVAFARRLNDPVTAFIVLAAMVRYFKKCCSFVLNSEYGGSPAYRLFSCSWMRSSPSCATVGAMESAADSTLMEDSVMTRAERM
mmetsp:Transcript_15982/g.27234  ORF Transcript_15982/g.27234 Transcript_15982/m.27234 type:complete len:258 (-) Transcript_15982:427-1200(-)